MADNVLKQISLMESLDSKTSDEAIQSLKDLIYDGIVLLKIKLKYKIKVLNFKGTFFL